MNVFLPYSPRRAAIAIIDKMARLAVSVDGEFAALRSFYEAEPRLHPPEGWQP